MDAIRPVPDDVPGRYTVAFHVLAALQAAKPDFELMCDDETYPCHKDVLLDISHTVAESARGMPDSRTFSLRGKFSHSTLSKFTRLLGGFTIEFTRKELKEVRMILLALGIRPLHFPMWLTDRSTPNHFLIVKSKLPEKVTLAMVPMTLLSMIGRSPRTTIVRTHAREYRIAKATAKLSPVLSRFHGTDPIELDWEDDSGTFSAICRFLNGGAIHVFPEEAREVIAICDLLELNCLKKDILSFIEIAEAKGSALDFSQCYFDDAAELQASLLELTEENFAEHKSYFLRTWFCNKDRIKDFASSLLATARARSSMDRILASIAKELAQSCSEGFFIEYLRNRVLSDLLAEYHGFVFALSELDLLPAEQVVHMIFATHAREQYLENREKQSRSNCKPFSCGSISIGRSFEWFLPELTAAYPLLFRPESLKALNQAHKSPSLWSVILHGIESQWVTFYEERSSRRNSNPLARAIAVDDVSSFQTLLSDFGFDIKMVIPPCHFDNHETMSLLGYAAFHGAIHCVRYLLSNRAPVTRSEMIAAVEGGNREIIRLFDKVVYDGDLELLNSAIIDAALRTHRNDVFQWVIDTKFEDQSQLQKVLSKSLMSIFELSNFEALVTFIELGFDPEYDSPMILAAMRGGHLAFLRQAERFSHVILPQETQRAASSPWGQCWSNTAMQGWSQNTPPPMERRYVSQLASVGSLQLIDFMLPRFECSESTQWLTLLKMASSIGYDDLIPALLNKISTVTVKESIIPILEFAVGTAPPSILLHLLPFATGITDFSAVLESASFCGNKDILEVLFAHQMRLNPDVSLTIAFELALRMHSLDLANQIRLLQPPSISHCLSCTLTILLENDYLDPIRFLFDYIDPNAAQYSLRKALQEANLREHRDAASLLLEYVQSRGHRLYLAAQLNDVHLLQRLISCESAEIVNCVVWHGSPLIIASAAGCLAAVEFLLTIPGIDLSVRSSSGETAFVTAARYRHLSVLKAIAEFAGDTLANDYYEINSAFYAIVDWAKCDPDRHSVVLNEKLILPLPSEPLTNAELARFIPFFLSFPTLDPNYRIGNQSLLHMAVARNNAELLRALLDLPHANPNALDAQGNTLLMDCLNPCSLYHSLRYSRHYVGQCLLESAAILIAHPSTLINYRNPRNETALTIAVETRLTIEIVSLLVASPRFNARDSNALIALIRAIFHRDDRVTDLLLNAEFDISDVVHMPDKKLCRASTLLAAIDRGDAALVRRLLTHPRFSLTPEHSARALFAAVRRGNDAVFSAVAAVAPTLDVRNSRGDSLLTHAYLSNASAIIPLLLAHPNFSENIVDGPVAFAAALNDGCPDILRLTASLPGVDAGRNLPPEVIGLFLNDEFERELHVQPGAQPVIIAAHCAKDALLQAVLEIDPSTVNARDLNGQPLIFLCVSTPAKLAIVLGTPGLDIHARDRFGNSVLMHAVVRKVKEAIGPLVAAGVDRDARNEQGRTAWELAMGPDTQGPADAVQYASRLSEMFSASSRNALGIFGWS